MSQQKEVKMKDNEIELWNLIRDPNWNDIAPMSSRFVRLARAFEWFYHIPMTKNNANLVNVDDMKKLIMAVFGEYQTPVWKDEYLRIWQKLYDILYPDSHRGIVFEAFNLLIEEDVYVGKFDKNGEELSEKVKPYKIDDGNYVSLKKFFKKKDNQELDNKPKDKTLLEKDLEMIKKLIFSTHIIEVRSKKVMKIKEHSEGLSFGELESVYVCILGAFRDGHLNRIKEVAKWLIDNNINPITSDLIDYHEIQNKYDKIAFLESKWIIMENFWKNKIPRCDIVLVLNGIKDMGINTILDTIKGIELDKKVFFEKTPIAEEFETYLYKDKNKYKVIGLFEEKWDPKIFKEHNKI